MDKPAGAATPPEALFLPKDIDHIRLLARWIVVAVVLGAIAGVVVHGVREVLLLFASLRRSLLEPLLFALPAFGGLANGFLVYRMERESRGDGIYTYIKCAGNPEERLRLRFVPLKILATLLTLGSGARGGLVGPLVAINAGIGIIAARWFPFLGRFVKDNEPNLRPSAVCGAAGAVGALLFAPLGGGIFAVEILFGGSLAYAALFPAILTSVTAFFVSSMLRGTIPQTLWTHVGASFDLSAGAIAVTIVAAVAGGVIGILFVYINKRLPYLLEHWSIPNGIRPVLGGALCGIVALIFGREVLYTGTDLLAETIPAMLTISGAFSVGALALALLGIGLAVGFTVGGSGSGGLTMPAITLGVLAGGVVTGIFSIPPAESLPFLIAGLTACLASSLNVPVAAAVISLEVFGAPTAFAAVLGSVIGYQIGRGHLMYRYLAKGNA